MISNLIITHNSGELGVDDAISVAADVANGYIHAIPELYLKTSDFCKFVEDIKYYYDDVETFDYSRSDNNIYVKHIHANFKIYAKGNSKDIIFSICCVSEEICHTIFKFFSKYDSDGDSSVNIFLHSYFMSGNQIQESSIMYDHKDLNYLSKSYYPYLDTELMFDQFFTGSENILLVVGAPGIGKSKLSSLALKYAYENPDKIPYDKMEDNYSLENQYIVAAFVKSTDVLSSDSFWRSLEQNSPDFVIIDDLDYMLTKRDSEVTSSEDQMKNRFLNQFLSFTDGFEKRKCKFIITTNQGYNDIDTALLRKGRLFDILELRYLKNEEAHVVWTEEGLNSDDFYKCFSEDYVLPADLGSEINKRMNKRLNEDALKSYIKEEGISKVQKAKRTKKIGL